MSDSTISMYTTIGAATAGTLLGIGAMMFAQKSEKNREREEKLAKLKERKKRYLEKKEVEKFIKDSEQNMKSKRRVQLLFNENDEMVEKEESDEEHVEQTPGDLDIKVLKEKLKKLQGFNSKLTVNIGDAEYDKGKLQITKDIFEGKDKTENAQLFIENLERSKKRIQDQKAP